MILVSNAVKLFQLIRIIWPRFSLFQKWSNYYNLLELSDWDLIIPTYWNYLTKIWFISKMVKLCQLIGIIWPRFSLFQKWSNCSNLLELFDRDSVYFKNGQIMPTYWNYLTEFEFSKSRTILNADISYLFLFILCWINS